MRHFTTVRDVENIDHLISSALHLKKNPFAFKEIGKNKTIGLLFFNPSLRTRLSTQIAAQNLGLNVVTLNISSDSWAIELNDGTVMNQDKAEHIKDAASMMGLYCDVIAIRYFPTLKNREEDYDEHLLNQFIKYSGVPVISMESATLHPLQSLADLITITEHKKIDKPKIVLTWAPHVKAIPQVVANSFAQWVIASGNRLTITHPVGCELADQFTNGADIEYDQAKALEGADFVYVKNWSSYRNYGDIIKGEEHWILNMDKLIKTNHAKIMHCLPVRRNLELTDEVLDSSSSLIHSQAENRIYSAQAVLKKIIDVNF